MDVHVSYQLFFYAILMISLSNGIKSENKNKKKPAIRRYEWTELKISLYKIWLQV